MRDILGNQMLINRPCASLAIFLLVSLISCSATLSGESADNQPLPQEHQHTRDDITGVRRIKMGAELSHSLYGKTGPKRVVLKIDLAAFLEKASRKRKPLNLALVFDRSGSMSKDKKFEHAIMAANLVVENLSDQDVISLIAFNEKAVVLSPAGRAVNKDFLRHRLEEFQPQGYTNLSAGILEAFAQIDSQSRDDQLKQVIVLTDGLANRGITDSNKLKRLVAAAHKRGIGFSTLGCGTKFDEDLLTDLAASGGGRYTFVRSSEQIPTAISEELKGLLAVIAQNVKIDCRAFAGTQIAKVYGRWIDGPSASYSLELGDVRDGESSVVLVELEHRSDIGGEPIGADITLTWDDPSDGTRKHQVLHKQAQYTSDSKEAERSANKSVVMYAKVLGAMEKAQEGLQGLDKERFNEARRFFDRSYTEARQYAISSRDQQLLNQTYLLDHFMEELVAASEGTGLHDHEEAKKGIKKEIDYRWYLLEHHR